MPKRNNPGCASGGCCGCLWIQEEWDGLICAQTVCSDGTTMVVNQVVYDISGVPDEIVFWGSYFDASFNFRIYKAITTGWSAMNGQTVVTPSLFSGSRYCSPNTSQITYVPGTIRVIEYEGDFFSCPTVEVSDTGVEATQIELHPAASDYTASIVGPDGQLNIVFSVDDPPLGCSTEMLVPTVVRDGILNGDGVICAGSGSGSLVTIGSGTITPQYVRDPDASAEDDPGGTRLRLVGGATYSDARKRIHIPGGGRLESVTGSPFVDSGIVAMKLTLPPPEVPTEEGEDGYGDPEVAKPVIRIYFESTEDRSSYTYAEFKQVPLVSKSSEGVAWQCELGSRSGGVDSVYHWEIISVWGGVDPDDPTKMNFAYGRSGGFDADGELNEYWVSLWRDNDLPGYAVMVWIEEPDIFTGRPIWSGENRPWGTSLEVPLGDPPGTYVGIERLDSGSDVTEVAMFGAGRRAMPGQSFAEASSCLSGVLPTHVPCFERNSVMFTPEINGVPQGSGGASTEVIGIIHFSALHAVDPQLPDGRGWYARLSWFHAVMEPGGKLASSGQDPAATILSGVVSERIDSDQVGWGRVLWEFVWYAWIDVDNHALNCDGLEIEISRADTYVVEFVDGRSTGDPMVVDPWTITGEGASVFSELSLDGVTLGAALSNGVSLDGYGPFLVLTVEMQSTGVMVIAVRQTEDTGVLSTFSGSVGEILAEGDYLLSGSVINGSVHYNGGGEFEVGIEKRIVAYVCGSPTGLTLDGEVPGCEFERIVWTAEEAS